MNSENSSLDQQKQHSELGDVADLQRRKSIKAILGAVTTVAAYNVLPTNWQTPVIEQVFLPAHAATSGGYIVENLAAERRIGDETTTSITVKVSGNINPPQAGQPVKLIINA